MSQSFINNKGYWTVTQNLRWEGEQGPQRKCEKYDFIHDPLKTETKMMREMMGNCNHFEFSSVAVAGEGDHQCEKIVNLPPEAFRGNHTDEILFVSVTHRPPERWKISELHHLGQEKNWYPLFSLVEESQSLLGFTLRSDLLMLLRHRQIEVKAQMEGSDNCPMLFKSQAFPIPLNLTKCKSSYVQAV